MNIAQQSFVLNYLGQGSGEPTPGEAAIDAYVVRVITDGGSVEKQSCYIDYIDRLSEYTLALYTTEVEALLPVLSTNNFAYPTPSNLVLIGTLIDDLKDAGAWALADFVALYGTDAVSGNIGRINLVKPSDPLGSYVNAITYNRKQGVKGDGVSAYIDTGFTPSTYGGNYSNNDASIGAYVFSQSTVGSHEFISNNGANGALRIRNANTVVQRINCNSNLSSAINFGTTGFLMAHKTSALSVTGQVNATLTSHVYGSNTTNTPDGNVVLFAQTGLAAFCDAGISLFIAGGNISSSALSVNTAVSNYMNALSLLP